VKVKVKIFIGVLEQNPQNFGDWSRNFDTRRFLIAFYQIVWLIHIYPISDLCRYRAISCMDSAKSIHLL